MDTARLTRHTVMLLSLALLMWLFAGPSQAGDQPTGVAAASSATEASGVVASGSVEDTLQACLARIPKDASTGQRLIAVQSCDRDETARKSIQAVPGR